VRTGADSLVGSDCLRGVYCILEAGQPVDGLAIRTWNEVSININHHLDRAVSELVLDVGQ